MQRNKTAIIIGGGPAGLSAAYSILKYTTDIMPVIIEENDNLGGLSKTIYKNGNGTDIGPHRFFTKNNEVIDFWKEFLQFQELPACDDKILGRFNPVKCGKINPEEQDNVFLKRRRFSRIYYNNHLIDYPIKLNLTTFCAIGLKKTILTGLSYIKSSIYKKEETNLETFMINRFGTVLYQLFFENYTEKVWGLHPSLISKEWGEQRIKKVSLIKVIFDAILSALNIKINKEVSLIDEYFYPKYGSSQFWNLIAEKIKEAGGKIILNNKVTGINKDSNNIVKSIEITDINTNQKQTVEGDLFISSMPIKDLFTCLNDIPKDIEEIAENLQYRDFILVNFVLNKIDLKNNTNYPTINNIAPDSWVYMQDNGVKAGRIDIMNNFSPYIIKNFKEDIVINSEYFCNENDEFWNKNDEEIIEFAKRELKNLNIIKDEYIKDSECYRFKKAYPAYFGTYSKFDKIKEYIDIIPNLYCIGRNGQHKYNNMDHSILSGITAAKIIAYNSDKKLLWDINTDSSYQETK